MREVAEALLEVLASGGRGALATVVRTSGSVPQPAGARLLLRADDTMVGTVGGGAIEHAVLEALRDARQTGRAQLLSRDLGYDLGMCCGGRMEIFIEPVEGAPRLWLFGAGHVAVPTAALARAAGFEVTVVDEREALNSADRFPSCQRELDDPPTFLRARAAGLGARDWLLIVTHDHRLDEELLELAVQQRPRFIGLVGSQRKTFRLLQRIGARLHAAPAAALALDRVYAPVGLDIGAIGPQEIAISIVAELVALRRGRATDRHLRAVDDVRLQRLLRAERGG
ncbi:MAG TPA: XdhC/CoxI family protein [Polyangia bacterium]|nr:XdhC/CoxI family protein [Polyangia bacterium]